MSRSSNKSAGAAKPEPQDTENAKPEEPGAGTASPDEVQKQREAEENANLTAAEAQGTGGAATPAEKGQQTKAAKDVVEQAQADAEARAEAAEPVEGDVIEPGYADSDDPVQKQRAEEAQAKADAAAGEPVSEEDALLLAAAPGGQRTALTGGKEGSTTVTHTAGHPRPASGPLDSPVTGIENYAATDDDPDNRVYADEAGPRDVFDDEPTKARYIDADGNALDYDDIFDSSDTTKTFVTTKTRVYESFVFPNTTTEGKRLAYSAGKRVARGEAENVRNQISVHSPIN